MNPDLTRKLSYQEILSYGGDPQWDETLLDIFLNKKKYYRQKTAKEQEEEEEKREEEDIF